MNKRKAIFLRRLCQAKGLTPAQYNRAKKVYSRTPKPERDALIADLEALPNVKTKEQRIADEMDRIKYGKKKTT